MVKEINKINRLKVVLWLYHHLWDSAAMRDCDVSRVVLRYLEDMMVLIMDVYLLVFV